MPVPPAKTAVIDGILTRYDVVWAGPPLLMMSPGGFDATIEKWRTQGIYTRLTLLDHLPALQHRKDRRRHLPRLDRGGGLRAR